MQLYIRVYLGVRTCEMFLCFGANAFLLMLLWGSLLSWLPLLSFNDSLHWGWACLSISCHVDQWDWKLFKYKVMAITTVVKQIKVYMTWKIFSTYLKGLSKYRRMAFFFSKYLFSCHFCIMQIRSVMTSQDLQLKNGKILNKKYLWKYWSSVLETWLHQCASQKQQNDTLSIVAIATLSAPVSLCQKNKYPHL